MSSGPFSFLWEFRFQEQELGLGTLAASILDWDFKRSVIAVMLGVILAGIIMGTLSLLLGVNTFAH